MIDQNQAGSQTNNQPVMGGNPYDLVDNKTSKNDVQQASVQNIDSQINQSVQQKIPVQNTNGVQIDENLSQSNQVVKNQATQENINKWPNGFTKKLVKFIAKLSGQPDPETWEWKQIESTSGNQNTPQKNNIKSSAVQNKNTFDNIMWGVTWFLDKVEKKVESVSGFDLDSSINQNKVWWNSNNVNWKNNAQQVNNQTVQQESLEKNSPKVQQGWEVLNQNIGQQKMVNNQQNTVNNQQDTDNNERLINQWQAQVEDKKNDAWNNINKVTPDLWNPPNLNQNKPT